MGDITIDILLLKIKRILENSPLPFFPLRNATPEEFYEAIGNAKIVNDYGTFVEQHTIEDYAKMPCLFLTLDGKAGIAVTADHNIVSIFNGGTQKGVMKTLIPAAIEAGGIKLDNYDSDKLSSMYELYGFDPVSKCEFNEMFASDDWNYERDGKPDIVFWVHNGDSAENVILNFGSYDVNWDNVQLFSTYEEAEKYRNGILKVNELHKK